MSDSDFEVIRQRWTGRLSAVRRRLRWHQVVEGLSLLLAATVVALLLCGLADYRLELSAGVRKALLTAGVVTLGVWGWKRLMRPLLSRLELIDVAAIVDRAIHGRAGQPRFADGGNMPSGRLTAAAGRVLAKREASSALLDRAIVNSDETLKRFRFEDAFQAAHLGKNLAFSVVALLVPLAAFLVVPTAAKIWAERWFAGADVGYPRSTSIEVVGLEGDVLRVPRGEPARIGVKVADTETVTDVVWFRWQPPGSERRTATLDAYGASGEISPSVDEPIVSEFRGEIPPLAELTSAVIWGGDARPVRFQIEPVDRPQIVSLELVAKHPAEAEPRTFDLLKEADVRLLRDTGVRLTMVCSCSVEAEIETAGSVESVHSSSTTYDISWTHVEPTALRVLLKSIDTGLESFPRSIPIGLLPDRAPSVTVRHSGVRLRVTPIASIPLSLTARDDFGIAKLGVEADVVRLANTQINAGPKAAEGEESGGAGDDVVEGNEPAEGAEGNTEEQRASEQDADAETSVANAEPSTNWLYEAETASELRVDKEMTFEVGSVKTRPGDVLKITGVAFDAAYSGAQERRSRTLTFRIVKEQDLFREIKLRLQQLRARLRKATDEADAFRLDIAKAEAAKDAVGLSRQFQVSRREVAAIAQQASLSTIELELNRLGGEDAEAIVAQLKQSVVQPLERAVAGVMDRQRSGLADLGKTDGQSFATNRDEAVELQEEIVATLNEVLKNMNQWDSFVDVVNQLNATIRMEQGIDQGINELRDTDGGEPTPPKSDKEAKPKGDAASDIFD